MQGMAVNSIQSGWGYGVRHNFDVNFAGDRHAQGEALESALETGINIDSANEAAEIDQARDAIDALITQLGPYTDTSSLRLLKDNIRTAEQARVAVSEAINISADLLTNSSNVSAITLANTLMAVSRQHFIQESTAWFAHYTDPESLRNQLNDPNSIYGTDGRLKAELIYSEENKSGRYIEREEIVNGVRVVYFEDTQVRDPATGRGARVEATATAAVDAVQARSAEGVAAAEAGDVVGVARARADVAIQLTAMQVQVDIFPTPDGRHNHDMAIAEIDRRCQELGITRTEYAERLRAFRQTNADAELFEVLRSPELGGPISGVRAEQQLAAIEMDRAVMARESVVITIANLDIARDANGRTDGRVNNQDIAVLATEVAKFDTNGDGLDATELQAYLDSQNINISAVASAMRRAGIHQDRSGNDANDVEYVLGELRAAAPAQTASRSEGTAVAR
jgi:hypothetical protein